MSDDVEFSNPTDIAIVGMSLRVPGARTVAEFWQNLRDGVESMRTVSQDELLAAGESSEVIRRKNYVPRTAELPGLADFDADFFGFSPKEALVMDPQHRQFLECAWEALEDGATLPEAVGGRVGVFAGCGMGSYFYFNVLSHRSLVDQVGMFLLRHTGNDKDFLATRASFLLNLKGPSINVQTACSTSLVAVHYACQSLLNGECDMALAGGVTIELPHGVGYLHQEGEVLSPDGHCRAFDHRAAGTVFGSGTGVVVLRRLSDALRDGDPIRGVIKGSAVNNDGSSKAGYLAPSVTGQAEAIIEALGLADVAADSIQYVECHGTGTYLGDPIEIAALTQAYRQTTARKGYCRIGSVKTNIGHLDTAAGVVGLIKSVLALEREEIPPTLNYEKPNPSIDFAGSPFVVNDTLTPWPRRGAPRRAAVNSLGVGGTNAHVIVEEAPARRVDARSKHEDPQLLVLSAKSRKGLDDAGTRLSEHLAANPGLALADVAYTLSKGRRLFEHRRVVAVESREDAIAVLAKPDSRRPGTHSVIDGASGLVFLYPGGGAQYVGMARDLYVKEPSFKAAVDEGLGYLPADVARELRDIWLGEHGTGSDAAERLLKPSKQLPAMLILEVALTRLWMSWGVTPAALIGHSMGENAAACISGVMSFESAVNLVHLRGKLVDEISGGAMLSVPLSAKGVEERLPTDLELAVVNAPELCVVTGPAAAIEAFRATLVADGVDAARIPIDAAGHSRLLDPILERFEAFLRKSQLSAPRIPIVSNLTGTWLTDAEARDPAYWTRHLRRTVRFADGMATLAEDAKRIYVEVGPGRMLSSLAKAQGKINANQVINSLPHAEEDVDDQLHFLTAVGRVWATGISVPIERMWQNGAPRRVQLPTYAFQHKPYFLERITNADAGSAVPQLSKKADIASWGWEPVWKPAYADTVVGADRTPGSFLVFMDDAGVGEALVSRLRGHGHRVTTVALGDVFAHFGNDRYALCPEHGREGYDKLLEHLASQGGVPERIAHLWLLTADESFRRGSSFLSRNLERGFYSLFYLAQALANTDTPSTLQIDVLSNGMQKVGDEALPYPEKATVLGPARVLPREIAGVSVRAIDVQFDEQRARSSAAAVVDTVLEMSGFRDSKRADALIDQVWDDLFASTGSEIVAHRKGRRWIRTEKEIPLDRPELGAAKFKERGVYLVTGGLGGLGSVFAEALARTYKARLVLIGRTELPARPAWSRYLAAYGTEDRIGRSIATILKMEEAGGEVLYIRADVTNTEQMTAAIGEAKARFGAINGVLHAAGIVKDELIALKAPSDIEDVFAPKVFGTLVLDEALKGEKLDLFVLFSSTSTDIAPAGQADYVAANAFLNAFAESKAAISGTPTVAIHWGIWNEVGLAAQAVQGGVTEEGTAIVEPCRTALFDRRVRDSVRGDWFELKGDASRHWILNDHRLKSGEAIWPGTGYLELIAEAARELRIDGAFEVEDLMFLRPLHVPDGEARRIRVRHVRESGRYRLAIESRSPKDDDGTWVENASARVRMNRTEAPPVLDVGRLVTACADHVLDGGGVPLASEQEVHLAFGPRWNVLRSIHFGKREAIAKLALDQQYASDLERGYLLHPGLLDLATGYAMALIEGYDSAAGLWVPMTYGSFRVFATLPDTIWSHVVLNEAANPGAGYATFDVTISDDTGRVVAKAERFTIKQLARGAGFGAAPSDAASVKRDVAREQRAVQELSPALARLAAQVDQGIGPAEGMDALLRALGVGRPEVIVSSMDLPLLQRSAGHVDVAADATSAFDRPDLGSEFVAPRNEVEQTLAGFWTELLGVKNIGIHDNFFDLGGHSLIAVRLFRMVKSTFSVDFPISVLLEAPTISACAELIASAGGSVPETEVVGEPQNAEAKERYVHLVPMHAGPDSGRKPFFICAGMFGNILNLRYLAQQIGKVRPVYGLQARGLYGDQAPHETFEEMARSYLAEIRTVQPHGPYLLGGFSGGGLVAYEMARQLEAEGEEVAIVVMLDTPIPGRPTLTTRDLISMKMQDLKRHGLGFLAQWAWRRIQWELQRFRSPAQDSDSADQFHNEAIKDAFYRALGRYQVKSYDHSVLVLRPRMKVAYHVSGGVRIDEYRSFVREDNGWRPYVPKLNVVEVPGDHDSMVLEPNVRVLAGHVRSALDRAETYGQLLMTAAE
ncbi:type I polyketide synthase [Hyphomicrobium sp.]|uniref:type I polyketide synthase n=1 Tax=Hyphomicrobium sp. TaxID=82 RepID=UPI002E36C744|nr:SDR family NAD(P)-dependent oxidoreductase [Hyphomicrobium sp.]HEX2842510.1 SDR family NAD(P)-dependent oxidoreductase [Hyphomicrobium sp.]